MNTPRPLYLMGFIVLLAMAILAVGVAWPWPAPEAHAEPGMVVGARATPDGRVDLEIEVSRLDAAAEYTATVSVPRSGLGSGGEVASAGVLGRFVTDAEGTGVLATSTATIAAGAAALLTEELFAAPGRAISIVSVSGEVVSEVVFVLPAGDE